MIISPQWEILGCGARAYDIGADAAFAGEDRIAVEIGGDLPRDVKRGQCADENHIDVLWRGDRVPAQSVQVSRQTIIIENGAGSACDRHDHIGKSRHIDEERLVELFGCISDDRHGDGLHGCAGREGKRAGGALVIHTTHGGAIGRGVGELDRLVIGTGQSDGENSVRGANIALLKGRAGDGGRGIDARGDRSNIVGQVGVCVSSTYRGNVCDQAKCGGGDSNVEHRIPRTGKRAEVKH